MASSATKTVFNISEDWLCKCIVKQSVLYQTQGNYNAEGQGTVGTVPEVKGQWHLLFENSKRQILKHYSLWMDNMMFSDLCRQAQLQWTHTHTHTPIHTHKTDTAAARPAQHTGSAQIHGWKKASAMIRPRVQTPLGHCLLLQFPGLHLWHGQHTSATHRCFCSPYCTSFWAEILSRDTAGFTCR